MKEKKKLFEASFSELDVELQKYLYKKILAGIGILLLDIACSLYYKNLSLFFIGFIGLLMYVAMTYYEIVICLQNKLVSIEGEIVEIYKKEIVKGIIGIDRNYILLKQDNVYIKIYLEKIKAYKTKNILKVYLKPGTLKPINEDTYECLSIFHIVKLKEG